MFATVDHPIGRPIPVYMDGRSFVDVSQPANKTTPPLCSRSHFSYCSLHVSGRKFKKVKRRLIIVEGFVDGSCYPSGSVKTETQMMGSGVYFGSGDIHNRAVLVPRPRDPTLPCDSLRAELYASLLFLYLSIHEKHISTHTTRLVIHQDSLVAIELLRMCHSREMHAMCPTRWAKQQKDTQSSLRKLSWGETITVKTILDYGDVLDYWWLYTRPDVDVYFRWVAAHQEEPKDRDSEEWLRWRGNDVADALAKLGAKTPRHDPDGDSLAPFADLPLYRSDPSIKLPPKRNPKLDILPLSDATPNFVLLKNTTLNDR